MISIKKRYFRYKFILFAISILIGGYYLVQSPEKKESQILDKVHSYIPESESKKITLHSPKSFQVLYKSKMLFKGSSRYQLPVLINGEEVYVKKDGRFYEKKEIKGYGKHRFLLSFIKPNNESFHLEKKVIYLPNIENFPKSGLKKNDLYFYLSRFSPQKNLDRLLKSNANRAQLAYVITKLKNLHSNPLEGPILSDLSSDHWAYPEIQTIVKQGFMASFPDGSFKPDEALTITEYIVTLLKALDLKITTESRIFKSKNVPQHHWTYPFIVSAIKHGLIPNTKDLDYNQTLSQGEFVRLLRRLPEIESAVSKQLSFAEGFPAYDKQKLNNHLETVMAEKTKALAKKQRITIYTKGESRILTKPEIHISGEIFPANTLLINKKEIVPSIDGKFEGKITLEKGENTVHITAFDKKQTLKAWYLEGYPDLKKHWIKKKAAELKHLGFLTETDPYFNPRKSINRLYFSELLDAFFKIEKNKEMTTPLLDIDDNNQLIHSLIAKDIMRPEGNYFKPQGLLKKIEAIDAIVKASNFPQTELSTIKVPYQDLQNHQDYINSIKLAYKHQLISKAAKLNPEKVITKAELISLLYQSPVVKEKRRKIFGGIK